jgi:hypothetical protein
MVMVVVVVVYDEPECDVIQFFDPYIVMVSPIRIVTADDPILLPRPDSIRP